VSWQDNYLNYLYQGSKRLAYNMTWYEFQRWFMIMKSLRGMAVDKSTSKTVQPYVYSNSARQNWCLTFNVSWPQNTSIWTITTWTISENANYDEGVTVTSNNFSSYTNADGQPDYYWTLAGRCVVNKVSILVTAKKLADYVSETVKGTEGNWLIDGNAGMDAQGVWTFETIPQTSKQYVSAWLKQLFPQWNSSMGGPQ